MAAEDITAVGLAAQIARLHQEGMTELEAQNTLMRLCRARDLNEQEALQRIQEAQQIWSVMSAALSPGRATNTAPETQEGHGTPPPPTPASEDADGQQPPLWLATLLAALQSSKPSKRQRQPDPEIFDGNRKAYQVFHQQLVAKVSNDKDDFGSDKIACDYAFSRLKGSAATLTLPFLSKMNTAKEWNFNQLLEFFNQMFGDPHQKQRAMDKLWSIKQGKRSVRTYAMEFQENLLHCSSNLDPEMQMMIFKRGLDHRLQIQLAGVPFQTLDELVIKTIGVADDFYRLHLHSKGSSSKNYQSKRSERHTTPLYSSTSTKEDTMDGVEYTGRTGKPRRLSNSEVDRLRREGRCFRCKEKGHMIADCTEHEGKKKKKNVSVSTATSSKLKKKKKEKKGKRAVVEELSSSSEEDFSEDTGSSEYDSDSGKV
jgi:hypothetical protein